MNDVEKEWTEIERHKETNKRILKWNLGIRCFSHILFLNASLKKNLLALAGFEPAPLTARPQYLGDG